MKGLIKSGINNIYTVLSDGREFTCRIKGKRIITDQQYYNPIGTGDVVEFDPVNETVPEGVITGICERKNKLARWNNKREAVQLIACNIDMVMCVVSCKAPAIKPGFIDRLLAASRVENIDVCICINKIDLPVSKRAEELISAYEKAGFTMLYVSAETGQGIQTLREKLRDKRTVFFGQSGVGKSSLINTIDPSIKQTVQDVSKKYDRGRHTTTYSILFEIDSCELIDTPGIKEFELFGICSSQELDTLYPEFEKARCSCKFQPCSHLHEPECAVKQAVHDDEISDIRYTTYAGIYRSLKEREANRYG